MKYAEAIKQLQDTGCYKTHLKWQKFDDKGTSAGTCIRVSSKASGRPIMTIEIKDDETVDADAVYYLVGEAEYLKEIHEKGKTNVEN